MNSHSFFHLAAFQPFLRESAQGAATLLQRCRLARHLPTPLKGWRIPFIVLFPTAQSKLVRLLSLYAERQAGKVQANFASLI